MAVQNISLYNTGEHPEVDGVQYTLVLTMRARERKEKYDMLYITSMPRLLQGLYKLQAFELAAKM